MTGYKGRCKECGHLYRSHAGGDMHCLACDCMGHKGRCQHCGQLYLPHSILPCGCACGTSAAIARARKSQGIAAVQAGAERLLKAVEDA